MKKAHDFFPSKGNLKPKQEFSGSAGNGKTLPDQEKTSKPSKEFTGSDGAGALPKSNS